jgi:hypothetical protein
MIGVGITENVYLAGAEVNDKKALVLTFKQLKAGEEEMSIIDMLESDEVGSIDSGTSIRLFPFNVPNKADMTQQQKFDIVINDIKNTGSLLVHLLSPFMTKGDIKLDKFNNTGISTKMPMVEFERRILNQNILNDIWSNMTSSFIRMAQSIIGRTDLAFRLKLRRQSKDKHFATLPNRYLDSEPCIEPMTVPKDQSKLKFSSYEIKEGLDKGDALPASDADPIPGNDAIVPDNEFDEGMFAPPADDLPM